MAFSKEKKLRDELTSRIAQIDSGETELMNGIDALAQIKQRSLNRVDGFGMLKSKVKAVPADFDVASLDTLVNQFIVNAVSEEISALKTGDYLKDRAQRGSKEHALNVLERVSDT